MATRQRGCAAKKASTCSRRSFLRNRIAPEALAACAWNTFLARSNPIVLTSVTDASLQVAVNTTTLARRCRRGASTPSLKEPFDPWMTRTDRGPVLRSKTLDAAATPSEAHDLAGPLIAMLNGALAV